METARMVFGLVAGILPVFALVAFGFILLKTAKEQNVATWLMWFVLDTIITVSMFRAGNNEAWLPLGFVFGALFVTIVLIKNGCWKWGFVEITCAIGSATAMVLWYFSSPNGSVIVSCAAMWIAGIPVLRDTWKRPDPSMWWFWGTAAVCGAVTVATAKAWSIEDRFFPSSVCVFNTIMTLITTCRRDPVLVWPSLP